MSALNTAAFTDDVLAKNFLSIATSFDDFEKFLSHLDGHVTELSKTVHTLVAKTPKVSKVKPFLLGAVVGVSAYRYLKKNSPKIQSYIEGAAADYDINIKETLGKN